MYPPPKNHASAKRRNGPSQMLLQGFQTWQHHLECSCWIFFWGQHGAANQERQGAGHEKLGKSATKVTRVGVQVNKCSRKGHACAKPIKLFRAKRTLTLSAHPQRRKVGEKNIPPEIKNKANYIISKFWIKFQCADPLQQKRRITIAPLRFQVIKIQIIQPLHVVLHLAVG